MSAPSVEKEQQNVRLETILLMIERLSYQVLSGRTSGRSMERSLSHPARPTTMVMVDSLSSAPMSIQRNQMDLHGRRWSVLVVLDKSCLVSKQAVFVSGV